MIFLNQIQYYENLIIEEPESSKGKVRLVLLALEPKSNQTIYYILKSDQ